MNIHQLHVCLFFSRGVSLQSWDASGILEREIALYARLYEAGARVTMLTYGTLPDKDYAKRLPGITILCNRWNLNPKRYAQRAHLIHGLSLMRANVFKTNQMRGADNALRAANFWRKPLVARCGYLLSLDALRREGPESVEYQDALNLEAQVFPAAKRVVLSTPEMVSNVTGRFPQTTERTRLIPNYVDTERFAPRDALPETDIVYVGRLSGEKNLPMLLEGVRRLPGVTLRIIGAGDLNDGLQRDFGNLDGRVLWQGAVANDKLPDYLHRSRVFVLPSHYEQLPKSLLEAMACGMPVVGTNVPGIRDVIDHDKTGWLCEPSIENLSDAFAVLLADDALRNRLGAAAREKILAQYSLDSVVRQEIEVLLEAADR